MGEGGVLSGQPLLGTDLAQFLVQVSGKRSRSRRSG